MADRKKKHTLDNILPERRDSYDSFYKAINSRDSVSKENEEYRYDERKGCNFGKKRKDLL